MIFLVILIVSIIVGVGVTFIYLFNEITKKDKENKNLKEANKKILHQKKSSEIRLGKIGEQMTPFFSDWPYDPNGFRFLGSPIDGIQFNEDEIIIVEIKTGKARLTDRQKNVKKLVSEGKVKFATFRVNENGSTFKINE